MLSLPFPLSAVPQSEDLFLLQLLPDLKVWLMKLMDFIFFKSITQTELCSQKIFAEYFQKQILNF